MLLLNYLNTLPKLYNLLLFKFCLYMCMYGLPKLHMLLLWTVYCGNEWDCVINILLLSLERLYKSLYLNNSKLCLFLCLSEATLTWGKFGLHSHVMRFGSRMIPRFKKLPFHFGTEGGSTRFGNLSSSFLDKRPDRQYYLGVRRVGFMGRGVYHTHQSRSKPMNPTRPALVCMVYPPPHESHFPNIQHPNNIACERPNQPSTQ